LCIEAELIAPTVKPTGQVWIMPDGNQTGNRNEAGKRCAQLLSVELCTNYQITGEPMKFLTLADWTGMVETELFAQTDKNYPLATVRHPVLEVTATVEPFENGRGLSLRVTYGQAASKIMLLPLVNLSAAVLPIRKLSAGHKVLLHISWRMCEFYRAELWSPRPSCFGSQFCVGGL
jgi:hypothetical protein